MANSPKVSTTKYATEIIDGENYIVIKMKVAPRLAKSEKSWLLCTTGGAETWVHDGMDVQMNVNVYVQRAAYEAKMKATKKKS